MNEYRDEVERLKRNTNPTQKTTRTFHITKKIIPTTLIMFFIAGVFAFFYYLWLSSQVDPAGNLEAGALTPWPAKLLIWGALIEIIVALIYIPLMSKIKPKGGRANSYRYWRDGY